MSRFHQPRTARLAPRGVGQDRGRRRHHRRSGSDRLHESGRRAADRHGRGPARRPVRWETCCRCSTRARRQPAGSPSTGRRPRSTADLFAVAAAGGERRLDVTREPLRTRRTPSAPGRCSCCADVTARPRPSGPCATARSATARFVEQSSEGIWRFEMEEPVPIDLPEEEQVDRFYRYAVLAECNA